MNFNQLYRIAEKLRMWIASVWISYFAGIIIEIISQSKTVNEVARTMINTSKLSVLILWILALFVVTVWAAYFIFNRISLAQVPTAKFTQIMKNHTCEMLNKVDYSYYSWGYNRNLIAPRDPSGWKPDSIYINGAESSIDVDYVFPDSDVILEGYTQKGYLQYCDQSKKIQVIRKRGDDRDRYAAIYLKLNSERKANKQKLEIRLRKTKWSQLQFSWDKLRRLDTHNEPITDPKLDDSIEKLYIDAFGSKEFLINSFCLHLILISKDNNVILSKISRVKANDYPETWAATIGEQIEKEDFYDEISGEFRSDFVVRWVKRALREEFDINEAERTERGKNELEQYVNMDSLKVLSVDMEGDIYNVALTCSLKLKINADQLKKIKGVIIDGNEMKTEFRECSTAEIRQILLNYPKNQKEYHPSTYLRLLMYHLALERVDNTCRHFEKDAKRRL